MIPLEKEIAQYAWKYIGEVQEKIKTVQKRYRSQVRGAGAMIQTNGLGQYLAFLLSKGMEKKDNEIQFTSYEETLSASQAMKYADGLLYQHLGAWLIIKLGLKNNIPELKTIKPGAGKDNDPLDFLLDKETTMDQMFMATQEAINYLKWARRFAELQLESPDTQTESETIKTNDANNQTTNNS